MYQIFLVASKGNASFTFVSVEKQGAPNGLGSEHQELNKTMKCLQSLLTDNAPCDSVGLESYKRGGKNAGILHEVQEKG